MTLLHLLYKLILLSTLKSSMAQGGAWCGFPVLRKNPNACSCSMVNNGLVCGATYNYDIDQMWAECVYQGPLECSGEPLLCGTDQQATCPLCSCPDSFVPSPQTVWDNTTTCTNLIDKLSEKCQPSEIDCSLQFLLQMGNNITSQVLPQNTVRVFLDNVLTYFGFLNQSSYGDSVLNFVENMASKLVQMTWNKTIENITTNTTEINIISIGPLANLTQNPQMKTSDALLDIGLISLAKNNNGSASVVLITYKNLEQVLKPDLFYTKTCSVKTMMSSVVTVVLPHVDKKELDSPVNFTLRHKKVGVLQDSDKDEVVGQLPQFFVMQKSTYTQARMDCVYWNKSAWVLDGCEVTFGNSTHTVCSCVHLSTFALIMQEDYKKPDNWIDLASTIALSVGLVFLVVAIFTFTCQKNPTVNNVARLNLCISLLLAHLLFKLVQTFIDLITPIELACEGVGGVLHFLFLCCFVWMFLEATQLFFAITKLKQVRAKQQKQLHWAGFCFIGYGIPLAVVGTCFGLKREAYGGINCWIKADDGFQWAFLGPVCFILVWNVILFIGIFKTLYSTAKAQQSKGFQIKKMKTLVIKSALLFFILGGSWIFGFFVNISKMVELILVLVTSQQGTIIFLVYCVFNAEVRQHYRSCCGRCK
ncbi:adhesion G protein-coupled receptor E1-like [Denticeps clupeoides]|uniref:adhesion G protein-coupled receptor E1-like n=1 Tax=Denticeps clupeoides TaxID=299321 RepID=UPI0010A4A68D|nr:adhesion G protein-coupled receptor E1-like [Denticeps clupeoides]XP_028828054.1 adhesion G protein-coupled receptor E1-like [Denticeps clupeoides]